MADKIKMSEVRDKFPMYGDLSDDHLLIALRNKYYADVPRDKFYGLIDHDTEREALQKEQMDSMSTGERLLAGAGKSFSDIGRSAKRIANMVGIGDYDQAAAVADQRVDKPLMDSSAGAWGHGLTDAALTMAPGFGAANKIQQGMTTAARVLPRAGAAITRGAAPYVGAAGSGALVGAATNPQDMSTNAMIGASVGPAGEAAGRVLSAGYGGAKAALEPLYESGRERILKRTLDRFATDPAAVRAAAQDPVQHVPGVIPTLAEATMDPGIAQLQRGAMATSPDVATALAQSRGTQTAGYRSVLDDLAGNDGRREFHDQARNAAANELYGAARAEGLNMTPALQARANDLMQRPAIASAMEEARAGALNRGQSLHSADGSVAGLERIKERLDGRIGAAVRAGDNDAADALRSAQRDLLAFLDDASPKFGEARRTFADMSRPINQMDIAQALRDKALPALTDLNPSLARVNANAYAGALRSGDALARQSTGLRSATMAGTMDPAQMAQINGVGQDMARYAAAQELARVPGSPTAQYLGAQNVLRQFMGPLGLPQSAADSMAGRLATGLLGLPFSMTKSQTEQLLARALTDPKTAARIMGATDPKTIAELLRPYAAQTAIQMTN